MSKKRPRNENYIWGITLISLLVLSAAFITLDEDIQMETNLETPSAEKVSGNFFKSFPRQFKKSSRTLDTSSLKGPDEDPTKRISGNIVDCPASMSFDLPIINLEGHGEIPYGGNTAEWHANGGTDRLTFDRVTCSRNTISCYYKQDFAEFYEGSNTIPSISKHCNSARLNPGSTQSCLCN